MLSKEQKKEAISKFKERKTPIGIYAVRCAATGQTFVGASRNLDAAKNGIWAGLRMGSHVNKPLQQEWNAHGEPAFTFEALEKLDDDVIPLAVQDLLTEKKKQWMAHLGAQGLL